MGKKSREKKERPEDVREISKSENAKMSWLWYVIFIGTCLIIFTPFIISARYFFPFVGPKSLYFMALVEVIFAAWIILMASNPRYRPRFNILAIILILFMLSQTISSVFGVDFFRSFWSKYERMTGLLMQFHLFAFFLVLSSAFKKKEDWMKIFGTSVFAAILMSFINLSPRLASGLLGEMAQASRGGATIGNSSFLGTYLLFNFFFSLYLFFNSKKWIKIFSAAGLLIIGIALYLSTARAALLSMIGGLVLLILLWLLLNKKKKLKIFGVALVVLAIISVGISVYLAVKPGNFISNIVSENIGTTFGGRLPVWKGGWQGFSEKPLFGWGLENFEIVFARHFDSCFLGPDCGGDIWYDRAHNIIMDTLVTTGIFGMVLYLGVFCTVFYVLWRNFFKNLLSFWTAGIFSVILISYFVQNLTVFDMVNSYMLLFLVLGFVGSVSLFREGEERETVDKPVNFVLAFVVLVIFLFSFAKFVIIPAQASVNAIAALNSEYAIGSQDRLGYIKKSLKSNMVGVYQLRDFFVQNTMERIQGTNTQTITGEMKVEFDYLAGEMEKTIANSELDFRSYLKLGQFYNIYAILAQDSSKLSRADEVLQKAIETSKTNQQGYWSLAQTKIYETQMQEALSLAEKALSLEPKSRQSNLIVIQVAKIMGDMNLSRQKALEAIKIDPSLKEDVESVLGEQVTQ